MIKVFIVDDHQLVREGIKRLLSNESRIKVIGEAATGEKAIEAIRARDSKRPNVVLMDINMPGIGGFEATRRLLQYDPDLKVLAVTGCANGPMPMRLMQSGALGYITKGSEAEEMVHAIQTVYSGQIYLSSIIAQQVAIRHLSGNDKSPIDILTDRELQVLKMIAEGQRVKAIADKLHLSAKTVNGYRYRLFDKLKIDNPSDVELAKVARQYELVVDEKLIEKDSLED